MDIRTLSLLPTAEEQMYHKNEDVLIKDWLENTHHVQTEVKTKQMTPQNDDLHWKCYLKQKHYNLKQLDDCFDL